MDSVTRRGISSGVLNLESLAWESLSFWSLMNPLKSSIKTVGEWALFRVFKKILREVLAPTNTHWQLSVRAVTRLGRIDLLFRGSIWISILASSPGDQEHVVPDSGEFGGRKRSMRDGGCYVWWGSQRKKRKTGFQMRCISPFVGTELGLRDQDMSLQILGHWFSCSGSTVGKALIRQEVLGRWFL